MTFAIINAIAENEPETKDRTYSTMQNNAVPPSLNSLQLADFCVFPKHVGVWEGEWVILDAACQEIQRFKGVLTQQIVDNQWVQKNEHFYTDGRHDIQHYVGKVAGPGRVEIESSDPPFNTYTAIAEEQGEQLIIFKVWNKTSGELQAIELINLVNPDHRLRTTQRFTPDGTLRGVMVITEHRIADK